MGLWRKELLRNRLSIAKRNEGVFFEIRMFGILGLKDRTMHSVWCSLTDPWRRSSCSYPRKKNWLCRMDLLFFSVMGDYFRRNILTTEPFNKFPSCGEEWSHIMRKREKCIGIFMDLRILKSLYRSHLNFVHDTEQEVTCSDSLVFSLPLSLFYRFFAFIPSFFCSQSLVMTFQKSCFHWSRRGR
jgi:hypothetical protein